MAMLEGQASAVGTLAGVRVSCGVSADCTGAGHGRTGSWEGRGSGVGLGFEGEGIYKVSIRGQRSAGASVHRYHLTVRPPPVYRPITYFAVFDISTGRKRGYGRVREKNSLFIILGDRRDIRTILLFCGLCPVRFQVSKFLAVSEYTFAKALFDGPLIVVGVPENSLDTVRGFPVYRPVPPGGVSMESSFISHRALLSVAFRPPRILLRIEGAT